MRNARRYTTLLTAVLLAVFATGCDSLGGDDDDGGASMRVLLTDAPFPFELVREANVTITQVSAVSETEGTVVLNDDEIPLNLLELQGGVTTALTAAADLPTGTYSKIVLNVEAATIVLEDGSEYDLKVPSERIQVLVGDIELDVDEIATVLLDFDVSQSFVLKGNLNNIQGFNFKPVVHALGYTTTDDEEDEGAELQGAVEEVGTDYVVVAGRRFDVDAETDLEDFDALAGLAVGDVVEIEYVETSADVFLATKIDLEEDGDEAEEDEVRETRGTVDEVGVDFVTVAETPFAVDARTTFEGFDTLADLTVGSEVEIDFVETAAGLVAVEIELAD